MAKKEKVLEHTSALQQNRTDPDMKVKPTLIIHRIICYIVLIFFSILCLFFFMIQYMKSSLPIDIIEAARIDGSGEFRTFNTIVLPMLKPALAVQAIFSFVASWNNYFLPSLIIDTSTKKTMPIMIAQLRSADFLKFDMGQVYMFIFIAIIPVIIVYFCLSKFIIAGVSLGGVKE